MIQIAYADTAATTTAASGGMGSTILMIVLMIAIFYFLMIRPENKRKKQAEEMRNSLKKGDWLTTIGGVYGRVVAITDRTVVIETSEDRVRWTSRPPPSSVLWARRTKRLRRPTRRPPWRRRPLRSLSRRLPRKRPTRSNFPHRKIPLPHKLEHS